MLVILTSGNVFGQFVGNYKSVDFNLFERGLLYLKGVDSYIGGMELTLESDSTFYMKTCSLIETGKWTILDDSLHLEVFTKIYRIDSLNNSENYSESLKEPFRPIIYNITENGFYREILLKDETEGKIKAADKLVKTRLKLN